MNASLRARISLYIYTYYILHKHKMNGTVTLRNTITILSLLFIGILFMIFPKNNPLHVSIVTTARFHRFPSRRMLQWSKVLVIMQRVFVTYIDEPWDLRESLVIQVQYGQLFAHMHSDETCPNTGRCGTRNGCGWHEMA